MRIILHVEHADGATERIEWPAERSVTKIGRLESAHVSLRGADVSRLHAVMERAGDELFVIDLGSATGTQVNGRSWNKAKLLDGDVVRFGESAMRIEILGASSGRADERDASNRPLQIGRCPRCERSLRLMRAEPAGYRDVPMRYLRCDPCALSAVESATLDGRYGRPDPLSDSVALRDREPAGEICPACIDDLDRLTLEWDGRWVAIEQCPGCGCVVLDDGEGFTVDRLIAAIDSR